MCIPHFFSRPFIFCAAFALVAGLAVAQNNPLVGSPWLDQFNEIDNPSGTGSTFAGFSLLEQEFVPTVDRIERVDLKATNSTSIPPKTGSIRFRIDDMQGNVLSSHETPIESIERGSWNSVPLPCDVQAGQKYRIVIDQRRVTLSPLNWEGTYTTEDWDGYPAGRSSWQGVYLSSDLMFRVFGRSRAADAQTRQLSNLSTRRIVAGESPVIVGFVVSGEQPRQILIRGVGPSLAQFDVSGYMTDPELTVFDSKGNEVGSSRDHGGGTDLMEATAAIGAFGLTDNRDAAKIVTLNPGAHTVHVKDTNAEGGDVLVEVYDVTGLSDGALPETFSSQVVNLSSRNTIAKGEVLIVGFVIKSDRMRSVLIRAIGHSLESFDIENALRETQFSVYDSNGVLVGENMRYQFWGRWPDLINAMEHAGAFFPEYEDEALLLTHLEPGAYTVHISSKQNISGEVLAEIYDVTDLTY